MSKILQLVYFIKKSDTKVTISKQIQLTTIKQGWPSWDLAGAFVWHQDVVWSFGTRNACWRPTEMTRPRLHENDLRLPAYLH